MTPQQRTILRSDLIYKIAAGSGFLINALAEVNQLGGKTSFTMSLKNTATSFTTKLLQVETVVVGLGNGKNNHIESLEQLQSSYVLVDNLLTMMLNAGRNLTPQAQELLNQELLAVAMKYGVVVE